MKHNYILECTDNYRVFRTHVNNRDVNTNSKKFKDLKASMRKNGFLPFFPLWCKEDGAGMLTIQIGHHRFYAAKELGIPVYFIVCNFDFEIWQECETVKTWTLKDHVVNNIRAGHDLSPEYVEMNKFAERVGLPISICISIFSGETSTTSNKNMQVKRCKWKIAPDGRVRASIIEGMLVVLKQINSSVATNPNFVACLLKCLMVPEFDPCRFVKKVKSHAGFFDKKVSQKDYLHMIDEIYNRCSRTEDKIPLQHLAEKIAAQRKSTFGRVSRESA